MTSLPLSPATVLACLMVLAWAAPAQARQTIASPVEGWDEVIFSDRTTYREDPDRDCIQAHARGSASGLIREVRADARATPWMRWAWHAETPLKPGNQAAERSRAGDDFVTRVYVVREGRFFWQTRAINYVWSREHPVGSSWPNPFTRNAVMVVVQSGDEGLGAWHEFERNVVEDFRRYHDMDLDEIAAVAVMTDADNTGGEARACYRLPGLHEAPGL